MIAEPMNIESNNLLDRARRLAEKLKWLSPTENLDSTASKEFGRSIEKSLNEVAAKGVIKRIKLRRNDAAVVMSIEHYEEILNMKQLFPQLIDRVKEKEVAQAADEFDELYNQITSAPSRKAADSLFSATPGDLRASYQPGATETK